MHSSLLQGCPNRFQHHLRPGQVTGRGPDMRGVGRLPAPLDQQPGRPQTVQRQRRQGIGTIVLAEPVTEVRQDAVVEAGILQLHGQGVLDVDPASHRFSGLTVRQVQQELQHRHRRQPCRREPRTTILRIPGGEVLIPPQTFEAVPHPHRRRPRRIARPRHPSRQLRHHHSHTRTNRHATTRGTRRSTRPILTAPDLLRHENIKIPDRVAQCLPRGWLGRLRGPDAALRGGGGQRGRSAAGHLAAPLGRAPAHRRARAHGLPLRGERGPLRNRGLPAR